ncbi:unnamed protein product [Paramecium primaurelia]|uniref:Uncharacterized protein n=1 Tax=Paramecium primaurelia TaxID=5886 RepID=A0A8S1LFK4_PARPR|nr:unnamed protein product [Paramecium primaurelia]
MSQISNIVHQMNINDSILTKAGLYLGGQDQKRDSKKKKELQSSMNQIRQEAKNQLYYQNSENLILQ